MRITRSPGSMRSRSAMSGLASSCSLCDSQVPLHVLVGLLLTEGRGLAERAVAGAGDAARDGVLAHVRPRAGAALDQTLRHQHLARLQGDGVRDAVLRADPGLGGQPGVRRQSAADDLLAEIAGDAEVGGLFTEWHVLPSPFRRGRDGVATSRPS